MFSVSESRSLTKYYDGIIEMPRRAVKCTVQIEEMGESKIENEFAHWNG